MNRDFLFSFERIFKTTDSVLDLTLYLVGPTVRLELGIA